MAKKIVILMLLISCLVATFAMAAGTIDASKIKVVDLELKNGQNTSLILGPGSPFSMRLYAGTVVEFEADKYTHKAIFEKIGDEATIKYTLDGGRTYKEQRMKLGDFVRWNISTGSLFIFLNYKMYNEREQTAVFEIGIPLIQKNEMPVKLGNTTISDAKNNVDNTSGDNNKYIKYLIGVIIVLILIIIVLGPRKKDEELEHSESKNDEDDSSLESSNSENKEDKKVNPKKKKPVVKKTTVKEGKGSTDKTYYTKPKKKPFNEEDVYVVKSSDDE